MDDLQAWRTFFAEAKERADGILGSAHIGEDEKVVIKDLLYVANSCEGLLSQTTGQGADIRVLQKKFKQSKVDQKVLEDKLDSVKLLFMSLIEEIKIILVELAAISKRHEATPDDPDATSAKKIKACTQKMIAAITQPKA